MKRSTIIKEQLTTQLNEHLKEYGLWLKSNFGFMPDADNFVNWFKSTHSEVFNKRRVVPFKLTREYVVQYCKDFEKTKPDLLITVSGLPKTGKTALSAFLQQVIPARVTYINKENTDEHIQDLCDNVSTIVGDSTVTIVEDTMPQGELAKIDINLIYSNTKKYGGSFDKAMGKALLKSDTENRLKLIKEFGDLYAKFLLM